MVGGRKMQCAFYDCVHTMNADFKLGMPLTFEKIIAFPKSNISLIFARPPEDVPTYYHINYALFW